MMLEIARFWSSIAHFNPERDHCTRSTASWVRTSSTRSTSSEEEDQEQRLHQRDGRWLSRDRPRGARFAPRTPSEALRTRIGITDEEVQTWEEMSRKMFVPFQADGIISQFEAYEDLEELDWDYYREKHGNIQRLDRILRAEGTTRTSTS